MSTTIDERVVEMRFDNKDFEKNVQTSLSTIEKLKQKLNFSGASKGLENVNKVAKRTDLSGVSTAIDTVHAKFSAMQVMGVTALANITNSAVNAGKRITKALTIDPIKTGFQEYETQINAVQTILANTQSKGTTIDDVNKALDELNTYADKTIYNFTEMTRNIGTFTAAGVDLDKSVTAIQGIANLAAVSGSTSQQASTAMYQLSQALAAGKVSLMDWNSVVNAGMGGQVFQDALKRTAKQMGKNVDEMIEKYGSFRESLTQGEWLTAEVLTETLTQLSGAYSEADLIAQGYSKSQAKEIAELAKTASDAATKVKTFTQLFDTIKESVQSGWTQTWEILIGDFEEAKELLSGVSDAIGKVINKMSNKRNKKLEAAMSSPWEKLTKKINKAGIETSDFQKALKKTAKQHGINVDKMIKKEGSFEKTLKNGWLTKEIVIETLESYTKGLDGAGKSTEDMNKKLKEFQGIVDKVWKGDFKNGEERIKALEKAGYDYAEVQELVNKTVNGHKLKLEDLSDAQLKNVGYTDEQIKTLRNLEEQAKKTGTPLNELIEDMSKPSGRDLLIDSFKNIAEAISKIVEAISDAWKTVFPDTVDTNKSASGIYDMIESFNQLTEAMIITDEQADSVKNIFEGLFYGSKLTWGVLSKGLVSTLRILEAVLGLLGEDLLSAGEKVAGWITKFAQWMDKNRFAQNYLTNISELIVKVIEGVDKCIDAFFDLEIVKKLFSDIVDFIKKILGVFDFDLGDGAIDTLFTNVEKMFTKLETWIKKLDTYDSFKDAASDIIAGLVDGLKGGADEVFNGIVNIAKTLIERFCAVLGINSPSTVFIAIGGFIVLGLIKGLKDGASSVIEVVTSMFTTIVDTVFDILQNGLPAAIDTVKLLGVKFKEAIGEMDIDFGAIALVGIIVGILILVKKAIDVMEKFANPLDKLGGLFGKLGDAIENFAQAKTLQVKSEAILNIAKAIALLAGSMYLLSRLSWGGIAKGAVALIAISGALVGLTFVASKMDSVEFGKLSLFMISFSAAILLLSKAMTMLSDIPIEDTGSGILAMTTMVAGMAGLLYVFGKVVDNAEVAGKMGKAGKLFTKMAVAMMIMAVAIKLIASIPTGDITKGMTVIAGLALMFGTFVQLSSVAEYASGAGSMMLKMAVALAIIPIVIRMIAGIPNGDIVKGLAVIAGVELLFAGIIYVSKFAGEHASKAGSMLLKMSFAIGILAMTMKLIATLSPEDIIKGLAFIAGVELLLDAFLMLSSFHGDATTKAGNMLFKMAAGMALMGIAIKIIATMSVGDIAKGLAVVAGIELLFGAMVLMTKNAGYNADKAGTMMIKMSAAILILVGAIALLSLLDPKDVAIGTAAISALLLCFSTIAYMTSRVGDCMKTMIVIAATIALLVGAVIGLTFLDQDKVQSASASISAVIAMLSLLLVASKYAGKVDKSLLIMVGVIGALGGILYLLSGLPVESTLSTAASLSILLVSLAGALKIISTVHSVSGAAYIGMVALSGIMLLLGGVLWVLQAMKVEPSIETATALSTLLLSMAAVTAILAMIGPFAAGAVAGAIAFTGVVGILGGLMIAIGTLVKYIPSVEDFLDHGIEVLKKIGTGLGDFVGSIVTGFANEVMSSLPGIGKYLSEFMTNAQTFIEGAKTVDGSVLKGVGVLAASIGALAAANLIERITSFITFGSSFSSLGSELSAFIQNAKPFIDTVKTFTPEMFEGVKSLTAAILTLTQASLLEGIARFLPMSSSISQFGNELPVLGTGLRGFINNLGTFTEDQVTTVKCAGNAIKALADAGGQIDGQAEWAKKLFGDNGLGAFSTQLPGVATNLTSFVSNLGTFTDDQVKTVKCAGDAIIAMAKAGSQIDGQSEWGKKLFGDNGLSTFSDQLPATATALSGFVSNLGTFTDDHVKSTKCAGNAIKALAAAGTNIDGQSEWAKKLFGDNGLGAFSGQLPGVATNLKSFVTNLGTFGEEQIQSVKSAVSVVKAMAKLGNSDLSGMITNLPFLGDKMIIFAGDLVTFCNKIGELDSDTVANITKSLVNTVSGIADKLISNTETLKSAGSSLTAAVAEGIKSKTADVNSAAKSLVTKASKAITDTKSEFEKAGEKLGSALADGIESKESSFTKAVKNLCKKGKSGASEYEDNFESAGKDLGNGLINGIEAKYQAAYDAGYKLGQKAAQGEKDGQQSQSPSKLTYQAGIWLGEGLVNGIDYMGKKVYNAGYDMGDSAAKSMSNAISKISAIIDSDMDVQPTIRPVLDLSNVRSGAGSIGSMFGDATVGVSANVGAISSMMSGRNQNGNEEVVSAINRLRASLNNTGNTTYQINGITYDDGSNVANAVEALARAALRERRV